MTNIKTKRELENPPPIAMCPLFCPQVSKLPPSIVYEGDSGVHIDILNASVLLPFCLSMQ